MLDRTSRAGWAMSSQLHEAWNFRAEVNPPAPTGAGQAPGAGQPQAGTGTQPQAGGDNPTTGGLSQAELTAELARTRREAAAHRAENTALKKAQADADAAKLSELDQAKKRASDLETENARIKGEAQASLTTAKIERIAAQLGIVDPEVAAALIKPDDIERDAAGNPTNLDALLKALAKAKPYLVAQQQQGAVPGAAPMNPATGRGTPALTKADVERMTAAQINARWDEVQKVLAGG